MAGEVETSTRSLRSWRSRSRTSLREAFLPYSSSCRTNRAKSLAAIKLSDPDTFGWLREPLTVMTALIDLPSELVASIIAYLSDHDVFAARQASRKIERASLSLFGKRFFRKKGYMLTSTSLAVLESVSQHDELRNHVQHVWFNPDCFTFVRPDCAPDPEDAPDPDDPESLLKLLSSRDTAMYTAYLACMEDHRELLAHSATKLRKVLTRCFAKLPNLKIAGMRRSEDHSPWGWRALRDAVDEDPRVLGPIPNGPLRELSDSTRLFLAIVHAVAASRVTLRRFYTDAIELDNIGPNCLTEEVLRTACSSIWYLELNITKAWLSRWNHDRHHSLSDPAEYGRGLMNLLRVTTQLKEIGLQIFPDRKQSHILAPSWRNPESWRESYPYLCLQHVVQNVSLPHLERVKLEKLTTSPSTLLGFLRSAAQRLTSLKIRDLRLLSDEDHPQPWRSIFAFLLGCEKLDYLLFYHLLYERGGVSFVENPPVPLPPSETDPTTGAPNPPFSGETEESGMGEEFFMKYEHIALQVEGREMVKMKLEEIVENHWYRAPIFSYQMDDGVWHTDTSGEEW